MRQILSLSQDKEQQQRHVLTLNQQLRQDKIILQRLQLLQVMRGESYEIEGQCPECKKKLTPAEVLHGFLEDVNDFTTMCPRCKCRFEPKLETTDKYGSKKSVPFYCEGQALHQLKDVKPMEPEKYLKTPKLVGMYRSLIVHYGTLRSAYKEIGIKYDFDEIDDWKKKARPFLGRISDQEIAEVCSIQKSDVTTLRQDLGIAMRKKLL